MQNQWTNALAAMVGAMKQPRVREYAKGADAASQNLREVEYMPREYPLNLTPLTGKHSAAE